MATPSRSPFFPVQLSHKTFATGFALILDRRNQRPHHAPMEPESPERVPALLITAFEAYLDRRLNWYSKPESVLRGILKKDSLPFLFRGIQTADDFAEQAFFAHEASSEETMLGNAWQSALAAIAPNSVGGGDLRTERDGVLWIVQVKLSRGQNAGAEAQDLRMLKTKLARETDHHPGRRNRKAMLGFVRGPARSDWVTYRANSPANADIDMFQYHYMAGRDFLQWCSADFERSALLTALAPAIEQIKIARVECLARVQELLRNALAARGLGTTAQDILDLTF